MYNDNITDLSNNFLTSKGIVYTSMECREEIQDIFKSVLIKLRGDNEKRLINLTLLKYPI